MTADEITSLVTSYDRRAAIEASATTTFEHAPEQWTQALCFHSTTEHKQTEHSSILPSGPESVAHYNALIEAP